MYCNISISLQRRALVNKVYTVYAIVIPQNSLSTTGRAVDIMSGPFHVPVLRATLEKMSLSPSVMVADVASLVAASAPRHEDNKEDGATPRIDWTDYHNFDEVRTPALIDNSKEC